MKRRTIEVMLFLLLGAIINVAVAWGCVLSLPPLLDQNERFIEVEESAAVLHTHFNLPAGLDANDCFGIEDHRLGWKTVTVIWGDSPDGKNDMFLLENDSTFAGWPLLSLWGWSNWDGEASNRRWAIEVPEWAKPEIGARRLIEFVPLRPIWPGFWLNTLFYATTAWLLMTFPRALRRTVRRRRGHCVKCGYDLRGAAHDACPECGKPIKFLDSR